MTIGERLQQLRKEKQMSQEELGNLLLVSRQTVSLWENNQTVPTIDNLTRLKEIFGVSIDTILTGEDVQLPNDNKSNEDIELPKESYSFSFNKKDLRYFYKISTMNLFKNFMISIFFLLFTIFTVFQDSSEEQTSYFVFFIALIFFIINLIKYIYGLLSTKKNAELVCNRKYTYEVFRNSILVRIFNTDDEIKTQKIYFNEFTKCWETPYCYSLEIKDRTNFIIKKPSLDENSHLKFFCRNLKSSKTDFSSTKITTLKTLGNVLFVVCIFSLFVAPLSISSNMASQDSELLNSVEHLKILHYFLPIPLLSIITGILLNKNKIRTKKNIICGVIIGSILLIFGFFPTIFGNAKNNLDSIEIQLGFEFPKTIGMNISATHDLFTGKQNITTLSFAESDANSFEEFIEGDLRWIKASNAAFQKVIPKNSVNLPTDAFLFYNTATNEFGKIPKKAGEYQLIYIAYNSEFNVAYIYEYQCNIK